jgi:ClpX C4-type zinc finger
LFHLERTKEVFPPLATAHRVGIDLAARRQRIGLRHNVAVSQEMDDLVKCSFCGESQRTVARMISGPGVHICNECVQLCVDIMSEEGLDVAARPSDAGSAVQVGNVVTEGRFAALWRVQRELAVITDRFRGVLDHLDGDGPATT